MAISRREFGQVMASSIGMSLLGGAADPVRGELARRPNIVFICSDQHSGLEMMGRPGGAVQAQTPNLKRLADMGVQFTNAYTAQPVCTPGRAALMTGRFASDVASYCNSTPFDGRVPTWGDYLDHAGYFCWATGKLDLSPKAVRGFHTVDIQNGHYEKPDITSLFRRPMCYRVDERKQVNGAVGDPGAHDQKVLENGLNFLRNEQPSGKPWVAYLGFTMPHPPFVAPQKYWEMYPPDQVLMPNIPPGYLEHMHVVFQTMRRFNVTATPIPEERIRRAKTAYYGMITELDARIGQVLDELEKRNELGNTLFIYTSDHGEMLGTHGMWFKDVLLERAARVPLIIAGTGLPRGKVVDTPVSHMDLVTTMLEMAGMAKPSGLRGHSLLPVIMGEKSGGPPFVYSESHSEGNATGSFMIRKGRWKYIYFTWFDDNLLFDIENDPGEMNNVAGDPQHAGLVRELHGDLTSLVNPDEVTEQAFQAQARVLDAMIKKNTFESFYKALEKRLGKGQAMALAHKHYA